MLTLDVRGGLNNQRECVINGIIAASELNLTLLLPKLHPVGRGNEKYAPKAASYEGRYADRKRWAHWDSLLNATAARTLLAASGIRTRRTQDARLAGVPQLALPPVETVFPDCLGARMVGGTCVAQRAGASGVRLMRGLLARWGAIVDANRALSAGRSGRVIFDAGGSLCWNAYGSRNKANCTRDFPRSCGAGYAAANAWNDEVLGVQQAVHAHVRTLLRRAAAAAAAAGPATRRVDGRVGAARAARHRWAAVHVRVFGCPAQVPGGGVAGVRAGSNRTRSRPGGNRTRNRPGGGHGGLAGRALAAAAPAASAAADGNMRASLEYTRSTIARLEAEQGAPFAVLYLVSSVAVAKVQPYFPNHRLTSKDDVFPRASLRLPFEVCAAIDYGVATSAPVYVGMRLSSFDVFAHAERKEAELLTVMRPGGKIC